MGSTRRTRDMIDQIPALAWSCRPDGTTEFLNRRWLDYTGLSFEAALGWGWKDAVHPDDLGKLMETWLRLLASGEPGEEEARLRRFDGTYRWFLFRAVPARDDQGEIVRWYGTNTDIDDRKRAEERLRRSEAYLTEALADVTKSEERLRIVIDTIPVQVTRARPDGSLDFINKRWLEYLGVPVEVVQDWGWTAVTHAEDIEPFLRGWRSAMASGEPFEGEARVRQADGQYRWLLIRALPLRDGSGNVVNWYAVSVDIEDRKQAEIALKRSEAYLAEAQRLSLTGSFGWNVSTGELFWSTATFCIVGYDPETKPTLELALQRVHPEDLPFVQQILDQASRDGTDMDFEHRLLFPDGSVKYVHVMARAVRRGSSNLEFLGAVSDVTATKLTQEKIRQNEDELRRVVDFAPQIIFVLAPDGNPLYGNRVALDYTGVTPDEFPFVGFGGRLSHPDDVEKYRTIRQESLARGVLFQLEQRMLGKDGKYRWFLCRYNPLKDEQGNPLRWYVTATDIEERRQTEEKVHNENLALREEIDRTSMFEEIVGTSPALQAVLSRTTKVAPTDSTVLIVGETGTGKELVARAIHRNSQRSGRPFVSVNCAALPPSLISSELFGHEKGAFTGATHRRLGRFELADGGTIFLDEVGELPADMQIALLRVLQEREIERVGGTGPIRINVRVIAATNRDLRTEITKGTFRPDLFYRLNVVPIKVPPLRERKEDVRVLTEYFIGRYARKAGKAFNEIENQTLDLFQSYNWPGNIRELQNVIERSVILSAGGIFSVDEAWLSTESEPVLPANAQFRTQGQEPQDGRKIIEAALRESRGRVSGPNGAAARLKIPATTLESRIKALNIQKSQFKFA